MPRLYNIRHASLASWIDYDGGWGPLFVLCISFHIEIAHFDSLGHHALKCAIVGPRIKGHTPLSHKHDKRCVGAHICLKYIDMPCFALCCCQNRFCRKTWPVDYMECRPTNYWWPIAQQMVNDHPDMVGGVSTWPVALHSVQRAYLGTYVVFRGAKQWKQRQHVSWQWISGQSKPEHACIGPSSEAFYCFLSLVNLLD